MNRNPITRRQFLKIASLAPLGTAGACAPSVPSPTSTQPTAGQPTPPAWAAIYPTSSHSAASSPEKGALSASPT